MASPLPPPLTPQYTQPQLRREFCAPDATGHSLLTWAVRLNNSAAVNLLLLAGADVCLPRLYASCRSNLLCKGYRTPRFGCNHCSSSSVRFPPLPCIVHPAQSTSTGARCQPKQPASTSLRLHDKSRREDRGQPFADGRRPERRRQRRNNALLLCLSLRFCGAGGTAYSCWCKGTCSVLACYHLCLPNVSTLLQSLCPAVSLPFRRCLCQSRWLPITAIGDRVFWMWNLPPPPVPGHPFLPPSLIPCFVIFGFAVALICWFADESCRFNRLTDVA